MNEQVSENTKAILLLTAPLIVGKRKSPDKDGLKPLTPTEYKKFALYLKELKVRPAELISPKADEILSQCAAVIAVNRLKSLLERGFLLSQAIEHWQSRAIWVMSRADAKYPRQLKSRLRENAPAILYGCGDASLLATGGLAVVGSRHVSDSLIHYTKEIGQLAAEAGKTIVSGGARGIDQAAMLGALTSGGNACGVLADSLEKAAMNREYRNALLNGQLVLISPYDPSAGFNVGHAMQRNKLIYAFAEASLVVNSDLNKGGTWEGAKEQLDKLQFTPVYVRSTGEHSEGLEGLRKKGALPWPNPANIDAFKSIFKTRVSQPASYGLFSENEVTEEILKESNKGPEQEPAEAIFAVVRTTLLELLNTPMKTAEVAKLLDVSQPQAHTWLTRLVAEGCLDKSTNPVRFQVKAQQYHHS